MSNDPKPLSESIARTMAVLRARQNSPEGQRAAAEHRAFEAKRRRRELEELADVRGVPGGMFVRSVVLSENPIQTGVLKAVGEALRQRRRREPVGLVLLGSFGTGKTSGFGRVVARHEGSARYATARDVCDVYSGAADFSYTDRTQVARGRSQLRTVDLLAVDEIGMEPTPAAVIELMVQRYDAGLVTLVAGNLTVEQFLERYYDGRLESRLDRQQSKRTPWVVMLGSEDLRGSTEQVT